MYEHQDDVKVIADKVIVAIDLLTDAIPDKDQVAQLLLEAMGVFDRVSATIQVEGKKLYRLKFIGKCVLAVCNRLFDKFLPDSES